MSSVPEQYPNIVPHSITKYVAETAGFQILGQSRGRQTQSEIRAQYSHPYLCQTHSSRSLCHSVCTAVGLPNNAARP
ncbi:hypothetical protein TNCV_650391 [Trichonephila clavipes]|nr:hypothetical protein TNCV_650391 [Trichonephila clavipes]